MMSSPAEQKVSSDAIDFVSAYVHSWQAVAAYVPVCCLLDADVVMMTRCSWIEQYQDTSLSARVTAIAKRSCCTVCTHSRTWQAIWLVLFRRRTWFSCHVW